MKVFFSKYWFFIGIAAVSVVAVVHPALGVMVRKYNILKIGIFLVFLITGLTLDTRSIIEQLKHYRVLLASLLSSLFLF